MPMNMNPMQLIQLLRSKRNPQQFMIQMLQQNAQGNPILENALNMVNQGNYAGLEEIARNVCKEKGLNYDESINGLAQNFR